MRFVSAIALGVVLAGVGGAALAFEEQGPRPAAPAPGGIAQPSGGDLTLSPAEVMPKGESGTKIRIPGLGVIGEIPKMDFGLELLYGATEQQKALEQDPDEANGLILRGTIPLTKPGR
jgi:hypothetical protein